MVRIGDRVQGKRRTAYRNRIGTVVCDWPGQDYDYGVRFEDEQEGKTTPTPFKRKELRKLGYLRRWRHNRRCVDE